MHDPLNFNFDSTKKIVKETKKNEINYIKYNDVVVGTRTPSPRVRRVRLNRQKMEEGKIFQNEEVRRRIYKEWDEVI